MKLKKPALAAVVLFVLMGCTYIAYQLFILPRLSGLPPPSGIPRYSVEYMYSIRPFSAISFTFGTQDVPALKLGDVIQGDMRAIRGAGFTGVKLNFLADETSYIANRIVLKAATEGLYPIGLLSDHRRKPKDRAFTPEEMAAWESYVREVVRANRHTVYFWEIWNEPDINMFRYGTPEEYVELLRRTVPIIKRENPNARVIVTLDASPFDKGAREFTEKVLAFGGGDFFDILSFHPYAAHPYLQENVVRASIASEETLVRRYGNRWPLMISEIGQPASEVSEAEQARLARFVLTEAAERNVPLVWFFYSDQRVPRGASFGDGAEWGLLRDDGSRRPLYDAVTSFCNPPS